MAWRVSILMALLGASAWVIALVPAMHAQTSAPPSVQISNGAITATVYLPDATAGYYRGTRFDWAGVIGRLEYRGHTFYAPWFTKTDAAVRFADPGKRTVAARPDGVDFTHELADTGSGFGYHYTKNVRLNPGRPELVIAHRLVNRGTKPIVGTVYNHNFLVLDGQTPGPDVVITAPFELKTAQPLDPAVATISGREFRYAAPVPDRGRVAAQFQGFGSTAADYRFAIENRKAGAGVEMIGDRPLSRLALWSIRTVLALEPFLALNIEPGVEYTWEYTYRYYTIP